MKLKLLVWILIIGNCATLVAYLQLRKHTSWAQQEPRAFATKPIGGVATPQTHKGNSPAKGSQDDFEPATVGLKDLRWSPKVGQVGSLSPNQKYDPANVHETTSA
jgi:hypothetical protein